jgi:hypothetical protein
LPVTEPATRKKPWPAVFHQYIHIAYRSLQTPNVDRVGKIVQAAADNQGPKFTRKAHAQIIRKLTKVKEADARERF